MVGLHLHRRLHQPSRNCEKVSFSLDNIKFKEKTIKNHFLSSLQFVGYTNPNKRAAMTISPSQPAKKPNLQDVKEYTEAARLRKQLAEEMEDDPNYIYDDDTHFNDDDDDENNTPTTVTYQTVVKQSPHTTIAPTTIRSVMRGRPPKLPQSTTTIDQDESDSSQIIVKDSSGSVHHAQIISEVLKKYPHLVKNNKNIKLKIMQKNQLPLSGVTHTQVTTKLEIDKIKQEKSSPSSKPGGGAQQIPMTITKIKAEKPDLPQQVVTQVPKPAPKRIDSKLMHQLIAKGAENMTGPWLCLRCGIGGRPISIPSYKSFRRHLINVHKERIDPRVCEYCGYRVAKIGELPGHHMNVHSINSIIDPATSALAAKATPPKTRQATMAAAAKRDVQHCIYCNKVFSKELLLYNHMKTAHKEKARVDGVIDFSEEDDNEFVEESASDQYVPNDPSAVGGDRKIKILSNITIPGTVVTATKKTAMPTRQITLVPSSEAEALSNVASGIATSLGLIDDVEGHHFHTDDVGEIVSEQFIEHTQVDEQNIVTKLVTADGAELQLTQSQKEEILSQLQGDTTNLDNVVMVLNQDHNFEATDILGGNSADPRNIVVVYSQGDEAVTTSTITTATSAVIIQPDGDPMDEEDEEIGEEKTEAVEEKENEEEEDEIDNSMEWTEKPLPDNSIDEKSEGNDGDGAIDDQSKAVADSQATQAYTYDEEKLKLISELQGDWTEEDEEEEEVRVDKPPKSKEVSPVTIKSSPGGDEIAKDDGSTENATKTGDDEAMKNDGAADAETDNPKGDTIKSSVSTVKSAPSLVSTKKSPQAAKTSSPPSSVPAKMEKDISSILQEWYEDADESVEKKGEKDDAKKYEASESEKDKDEAIKEENEEETKPPTVEEKEDNDIKIEDQSMNEEEDGGVLGSKEPLHESMEVDESDSSTTIVDEELTTKEVDTKSKPSAAPKSVEEKNSEIKTLINDWDDEDGDL